VARDVLQRTGADLPGRLQEGGQRRPERRLYVIVDLHWSAPTGQCDIGQPGFADANNAVPFWKQLADAYGSNPAVIFELFNEPFADNVYGDATGATGLACLASGCSYPTFCHQNNGASNAMQCAAVNWQVAGELGLLATIRGEGASNVALLSPPWWAGEIEYWLQAYAGLTDANTCASMHAYSYSKGMGPLNAVQAAGHCIVITEFTTPVGTLGAAGPLQALGIGTVSWGPNSWGGAPSVATTGW
jgi:endoglucanase